MAMLPTLFGVTVVSFCIMQLAPGDPLRNSLTATGEQGKSAMRREAYLIQKRDLKLDKPLLLNFRAFHDYHEPLRQAAFFRGRSEEEIVEHLRRLVLDPDSSEHAARIQYLKSLPFDDFDSRLSDPRKHARLATAIRGFIQMYCEDVGIYGVSAAVELLTSADSDLKLKIGLIDCVDMMVVEAHKFTYSRNPKESETPLVMGVWKTWWDREQENFPPLDEDRGKVLEEQLATMSGETSRTRLFELLEEEYFYERDDMRFFAEKLLGESVLAEKSICAVVLNLYITRPLPTQVPLSIDEERVRRVSENWLAHYEPRRDIYQPTLGRKTRNILADTQYAHMVWRLVSFQFGRSALKSKEFVSDKLWTAFAISAPLMIMAELVIYFVSIPLGILCAVNRGNIIDRLLSLKLFLLYSVPPFVAGMLFLLFFCYGDYLKLFPMDRLHSEGADDFGFVRYSLDYLWHACLPVMCLSLFSLAALAMYARTSMLDVVGQDYIRTARAKGVTRTGVVYKHALRNAMIPILTLLSNSLPALLGGSVLIEVIFSIPGMGMLGWESIMQKDFPTLMALIYVQAIVVLLSILLTDILYVIVDPRISFAARGSS